MNIAFVCMPMMSLDRPAIGVSLLAAELRNRGHKASVHYLNWSFAERIGIERYRGVSDWLSIPHEAMPGEMVFRSALYGIQASDPLFSGEYADTWGLTDAQTALLRGISCEAVSFLAEAALFPQWRNAQIIGFTSTFEQNLSSLALARRIKSAYPDKIVAFGGANWEGEMGRALLERFEFVDFAALGEADLAFPALVDALSKGESSEIAGIATRGAIVSKPPALVADMDDLPYPYYDDFLSVRKTSPLGGEVAPLFQIQTSRGCWFGERSHCTFCGLNGSTMTFRSKSAARVRDELRWLQDECGAVDIDTTDEILDMKYLDTLMPMIGSQLEDIKLFYEVKANLSHDNVAMLRYGHVTSVQPGIESLSNRVLRLMRKGTTTTKNVEFLKWCQEYGIIPYWNLLYGIPGETEEDYEEIIRVIDRIWWLTPPSGGAVRLRIDRFSPYHSDPATYGLAGVRPSSVYRQLYGDDGDLSRLAYYFTADYEHCADTEVAARMRHRVSQWQEDAGRGQVWCKLGAADDVEIEDSRPGAASRVLDLSGWQARLFRLLDSARDGEFIASWAARSGVAGRAARQFVAELEDRGLVLTVGERYVNLAVHASPCAPRLKASAGDAGRPQALQLRLLGPSDGG